ncbi:MAG: M56 family metallopeptidase [Bacteroidota bacterium]
MITYLITTTLLSWIGWLLYIAFVRNKATLYQQKLFIYAVLVLSLTVPLVMARGPLFHPHPEVKPMGWANSINPIALQSYCKCESPDYTHRIHYRANAAYQFLFTYKEILLWTVLLAIGGVLIHFGLQLQYLRKLIKNASKEIRSLDGQSFYLLFPQKEHAVGAFGFRHKYIIWQEGLSELTLQEQEAIFRHELSHLRQYNTFEKFVLRIIQCLWILNPAFYLFRKELHLLSECMADQASLQQLSPKAYAQLLIKVQEGLLAPLATYLKGSVLSVRIHRLIQPQRPSRLAFPVASVLLLFAQLFLVQPVVSNVSQTLDEFQTMEKIYHQTPDSEEAIYCTDCETVCTPDVDY